MKFRRTLLFLAVLTAQAFAQQARTGVDVYIDGRGADRLLGPGRPLSAELFKKIGIRLTWHKGEVPLRGTGLIVRTVEHAPDTATGEALAMTRILGSTREISVYEDRLESFLALHRSLASVATAYVLAHELAHAIQGIGRHSESGIMKAHWSDQDFQEMFFHKLAFAPSDVELIYTNLADNGSVWRGLGATTAPSHRYIP